MKQKNLIFLNGQYFRIVMPLTKTELDAQGTAGIKTWYYGILVLEVIAYG